MQPARWWRRCACRNEATSIPGHELAGVVTTLGYGSTGLSVGQRVFGLTDWYRDGTLAEYAAVEARNLAPLPADVDFTVGASLPISGLTAWLRRVHFADFTNRFVRDDCRPQFAKFALGPAVRMQGRPVPSLHRAQNAIHITFVVSPGAYKTYSEE